MDIKVTRPSMMDGKVRDEAEDLQDLRRAVVTRTKVEACEWEGGEQGREPADEGLAVGGEGGRELVGARLLFW